MLGWIAGVVGIVKHAGKIGKVVKVVVGAAKDPNDDFAQLLKSFKAKLDSDGDGKTDLTKAEVLEFLAEVVIAIAKRL